jgi:Zn-dependent membrane protease YugP
MWPAVAFASNAWLILLLIGAFSQLFGLVTFAVILYAVVVLFQIVTCPWSSTPRGGRWPS